MRHAPVVVRRLAAWTLAVFMLTGVILALTFAGLCAAADRLHRDVFPELAAKVPLLSLKPRIIFAGDSRTAQPVDPALAARILGQPPGSVVNIATAGSDPLAYLAVARLRPGAFARADLVLGLSPYHINDGNRQPFFFSGAAIARLAVARALITFVPGSARTLMWFIRDAFKAAALHRLDPDYSGPLPDRFGQELHPGRILGDEADGALRWRDEIGSRIEPYEQHNFYRDWQPDGYKADLVRRGVCALRPLVRRLVIVTPPWAPIAPFTARPAWRRLEAQFHERLAAIAHGCGCELVVVDAVERLGVEDFSDEAHVNAAGAPIYTAALMKRLGYDAR